MKLHARIAALLVTTCCLQLTVCVPLAKLESVDPCDLANLGNIPKCEVDDKMCKSSNEEKLAKRKSLCEKNSTCSYCHDLDSLTDQEPLFVDPEIVAPIDGPQPANDDSEEAGEPDAIRAPIPKLIERNIIIENDNETQYYRGFVESGANITTIIRLTNLINNTNIVNMPTTLNNTNINNIHIHQNKTSNEGGKFGMGYTENGPCCFAVEPKSCMRSTSGTKCHQKKQKVCGRQCTKKVIHRVHHRQNPCYNTYQWPYTSCPPSQPQYNPGFYPGYYPVQQNPPPQFYPGYYPVQQHQPPPVSDEFDDEDDIPLFPDDDLLENPESGWTVGSEKCKVVSEDGLQIVNCTTVDFEHPFARNTVADESIALKREVRHTKHRAAQVQPPEMFYPVMNQPMGFYQPVYYQPVFMPQYYAQPVPMSYYQPPQLPLPPVVEQDSYFDNDFEESEATPHRKPKKSNSKRPPIVMEVDDEL